MTVSFVWHPVWPAPQDLVVRQVYAWILDQRGRVLLLDMPGGWNLPGGTPEPSDEDWAGTLRREVAEEADVTVRCIEPLGYQEVRRGDGESYVQLRVAARLHRWGTGCSDPDNGLVYPRVWAELSDAAELLGWGAPGRAQAAAAAAVATSLYGLREPAASAQGASAPTTPVMQVV